MTSKTIKTKRPVTRKSAMFFLTLALIITSLLYLFPLLWFLLSAFKPGTELFAYPLKIIPENPTIQNFIDAWTTLDFFRYFRRQHGGGDDTYEEKTQPFGIVFCKGIATGGAD